MNKDHQKINVQSFSNVSYLAEKTTYSTALMKKGEKYLCLKHFKKNKSVLDVGCGLGRTTRALYERGFSKVYGVDISKDAVEYAKKHSPKQIKYKVGNMMSLNYPDRSFDNIIISFNSIDYLTDTASRRKTFEEMFRLLKPGGILIYSTHDYYYWLNFLSLVKDKILTKFVKLRKNSGLRKEQHNFGEIIQYYSTKKLFKEIEVYQEKYMFYRVLKKRNRRT